MFGILKASSQQFVMITFILGVAIFYLHIFKMEENAS